MCAVFVTHSWPEELIWPVRASGWAHSVSSVPDGTAPHPWQQGLLAVSAQQWLEPPDVLG